MNYFIGKSILIVSSEAWSHIPLSKHHYSIELTRIGAKVFFLNPPSDKDQISQPSDFLNLSVIDYRATRGINSLPGMLRNFFNRRAIKKIKKKIGSIDVVWSFDPFRFQNLNLFGATLKIFHPVDVHVSKHEPEAAQTADIILSVSKLILKRYDRFPAVKAKINHGLQSHFLNPPVITSADVKIVGYAGNLDNYCIDIPTLVKIVRDNPGIIFYFIGPYRQDSILASELKNLGNCKLIGRVPSAELPIHFAAADMFLMCYDGADREVNSNHHKILEFLSTGKPLVMNFTDEYTDKRNLVAMSENNYELPIIFKTVINNFARFIEPEVVRKRIEFAHDNTYQAQVIRISELAMKILPKL